MTPLAFYARAAFARRAVADVARDFATLTEMLWVRRVQPVRRYTACQELATRHGSAHHQRWVCVVRPPHARAPPPCWQSCRRCDTCRRRADVRAAGCQRRGVRVRSHGDIAHCARRGCVCKRRHGLQSTVITTTATLIRVRAVNVARVVAQGAVTAATVARHHHHATL